MADVVLAVDPGLMTGWVVWSEGEIRAAGQSEFFDFCEEVEALYMPAVVGDQSGCPTHIVCERYDISAETLRKSRQYEALELIGVLKYIAHREGAEYVASQRSNKTFSNDDRLRAAGWLARPKHENRHENDAKRHLLTWLCRTKRMEVPRGTAAP